MSNSPMKAVMTVRRNFIVVVVVERMKKANVLFELNEKRIKKFTIVGVEVKIHLLSFISTSVVLTQRQRTA